MIEPGSARPLTGVVSTNESDIVAPMIGPTTGGGANGLTNKDRSSASPAVSCFWVLFADLAAVFFSARAALVRLTEAASGAIGAVNIRRDNRHAVNTLRLRIGR